MRLAIVSTVFAIGLLSGPAHALDAQVSPDLKIHYRQSGSGPLTLLLVPGWSMSSEVYERQLSHFKNSKTYTVYAIDPRGQGHSSKTINGYSYTQKGKDVEAFIQKLKLRNVVLAGWSYGSLDVLSWVSQFRHDNLKGLVIIDGPPKTVGDDNTKEWVWYGKDDADGARRSFTLGAVDSRKQFTTDFVSWMLENPTDVAVRKFTRISLETSDTVAALTNETGAYADYTQPLASLDGKVPTLIISRGEWEGVTRRWVAVHAPAAEVVAMGKHLMFWERSVEFNNVLDSFLHTQVVSNIEKRGNLEK